MTLSPSVQREVQRILDKVAGRILTEAFDDVIGLHLIGELDLDDHAAVCEVLVSHGGTWESLELIRPALDDRLKELTAAEVLALQHAAARKVYEIRRDDELRFGA